MKTIICFVSTHHGNTRRIADAMAHTLDADVLDLATEDEEDPTILDDYDLIGLGSGIYALRHHPRLLHFAARLPSSESGAVFLFSTRGFGPAGPYHLSLRRKVRNLGYRVVGEFSCLGYDTFGPLSIIGGINRGRPNDGDLERAMAFARCLSGEVN